MKYLATSIIIALLIGSAVVTFSARKEEANDQRLTILESVTRRCDLIAYDTVEGDAYFLCLDGKPSTRIRASINELEVMKQYHAEQKE